MLYKPLAIKHWQFPDATWRRLPPAAVWQTGGGYARRARSLPSAPGSAGGCRQWWGTGMFATWRHQTLQKKTKKNNNRLITVMWRTTNCYGGLGRLIISQHGRTHRPSEVGLCTEMKTWIWCPWTQSGFHPQAEPSDMGTRTEKITLISCQRTNPSEPSAAEPSLEDAHQFLVIFHLQKAKV